MVVVVSEHCHINASGKLKKLVCECNPDLAIERGCKGNCSCWRRREKLCSPQACGCRGRCGRVEADAEEPSPAASQAQVKPGGVDGSPWSTSGGTLNNTSLPKGWERESKGDVLSGTSDSDADGRLLDEDGYSDASTNSDQGEKSVTLEKLYGDGF